MTSRALSMIVAAQGALGYSLTGFPARFRLPKCNLQDGQKPAQLPAALERL
jgi:hypothetical protein